MKILVALYLIASVALAAGIEFTQPYAVKSDDDYLPFIDLFNFTHGGEAIVYLDLTLKAPPSIVQERVMMYFLLCSDVLLENEYCRNRTIGVDAGCKTYPLRQTNTFSFYNETPKAYHTTTYLHIRVANNTAGIKYAFLDICEAIGGVEGWLPSCLIEPTNSTSSSPCFECLSIPSSTNAICEIAPRIQPNVTGQIDIAMCDGDGHCLGDSVADILYFYSIYACIWVVLTLVWVAPILKKPYLCIRLHYLFAMIALMETTYSLLSVATFMSPFAPIQLFLQLGYSVVGGLFLQFLSRCFALQLIMMISDGYQVTQNGLINPTWVSLDWTFVMFWTICRNASLYSNSPNSTPVLVQIQWCIACYLVFSLHNHSRRLLIKLNNISYEMQIRLHIDPSTTPIVEKIRIFRVLPSAFILYFPLLWLNSQLGLDPISHFFVDHGIFTVYCLYVGYRFRVRRFYHEFISAHDEMTTEPEPQPTTFVLVQPPNPQEPTACGALTKPRSSTTPRQDPL
ncbi:hypothetical protein THRCLA_20441 [Thraustotheca clavata]|uniref:Transmembrane protein n=1 Tax=Thraustotheca clavata TaxID=74557 RepID=A0A1W0A754_9STRA|nr:hypothetical protein THRCLA_20441 [Thraustotheca clavata]